MNLPQIKYRAEKEDVNLLPYIEAVLQAISRRPTGTDIHIPDGVIPHLERYCDTKGIPFHPVAEDWASVASTYSALVTFESRR